MDNDDVTSVKARREYMGNVTMLVNQKSLSRGARYSRKRVGSLSVSHTASVSLTAHVFSIYIPQSSCFEGGRETEVFSLVASFYSRRKPT